MLSRDGNYNHTFIRVVVVKLGLPLSRRSGPCLFLTQHFLHTCKYLIQKAATNIRRRGSLGDEQPLTLRCDPIEMDDYKPVCGIICYGQMEPGVRIKGQVMEPLCHTAGIDSAQELELLKCGRKVNHNTDMFRAGLF